MRKKWIAILTGTLLATLSATATARDQVSFSVFVGVPGVAYTAPAPVYYYPPQAVYYAPPVVYYAPAPWAARADSGRHRGWHYRHRHHR